jgi:integrase
MPLSARAVELLRSLPRMQDSPFVFAAARGGQLSDMTLSKAMRSLHEATLAVDKIGFVDRVNSRPAVPHGLRSTFRDWVAEKTNFPADMAEVALAHRISSAVEAAYRRGDMIEKRRTMMDAWSDFLNGVKRSGNVLSFSA